MSMKIIWKGIVLVISLLCISHRVYAEIDVRFRPPTVDGKVDYKGERFAIKDQELLFVGYGTRVFREKFQLRKTRPDNTQQLPTHSPPFIGYESPMKPKFLVRTNQTGLIATIKEIALFKDVQGFVRIDSESDALEYLRFVSSYSGPEFRDVKLQEIHCVPDNTQTLEPYQGTVSEFAQFGFLPPSAVEIVNGKLSICHGPPGNQKNKSTSAVDFSSLSTHLAHGDLVGVCDFEAKQKNTQKQSPPKKGPVDELKTFIVVRTMHSTRQYPDEFVRVVEEVKSDGQWRIVEIKKIDVSREVALPIFVDRGL